MKTPHAYVQTLELTLLQSPYQTRPRFAKMQQISNKEYIEKSSKSRSEKHSSESNICQLTKLHVLSHSCSLKKKETFAKNET